MTTTTPTANLTVLESEKTDLEHFIIHLAAFCNGYVMEIAKPIMEHSAELYEDAAIVKLVNLWFEADRSYNHKRQSYLIQWAKYTESDEDFPPYDAYKWIDTERKAYKDALYALLVK